MIPLTTTISGKCMDLPAQMFPWEGKSQGDSRGREFLALVSHGGEKPNLKVFKSNQEIWK